jgi:Homeodomain-like domain
MTATPARAPVQPEPAEPVAAPPAPSPAPGRARAQALVVTVAAAAVPTVLAGQGMAGVGRDVLGLPLGVAVGLATFLELALLASALLARAQAVAGRPGGPDTAATWVLASGSGAFSAAHEVADGQGRPTGAVVLAAGVRLVAPIVAAWLWHRVMDADRDHAVGVTRGQGRAAARRRARVLDLGWAAVDLTRLTAPHPGRQGQGHQGPGPGVVDRARRRLDAAHDQVLRRDALATDPQTQAEVGAVLARLGLTPADLTPTTTDPTTRAGTNPGSAVGASSGKRATRGGAGTGTGKQVAPVARAVAMRGAGDTQTQIAARLGVTERTVRRWLSTPDTPGDTGPDTGAGTVSGRDRAVTPGTGMDVVSGSVAGGGGRS